MTMEIAYGYWLMEINKTKKDVSNHVFFHLSPLKSQIHPDSISSQTEFQFRHILIF